MSKPALQAYKAALRATKTVFSGDGYMLLLARAKIREGFEEKRGLTDAEEIEKEVTHLNEVAKFLVKNVVQGEKQANDRFHLKFHAKTELGSNETIKQSNRAEMGSLAGVKVRKCSDN